MPRHVTNVLQTQHHINPPNPQKNQNYVDKLCKGHSGRDKCSQLFSQCPWVGNRSCHRTKAMACWLVAWFKWQCCRGNADTLFDNTDLLVIWISNCIYVDVFEALFQVMKQGFKADQSAGSSSGNVFWKSFRIWTRTVHTNIADSLCFPVLAYLLSCFALFKTKVTKHPKQPCRRDLYSVFICYYSVWILMSYHALSFLIYFVNC